MSIIERDMRHGEHKYLGNGFNVRGYQTAALRVHRAVCITYTMHTHSMQIKLVFVGKQCAFRIVAAMLLYIVG